jgi:hypothetical protein
MFLWISDRLDFNYNYMENHQPRSSPPAEEGSSGKEEELCVCKWSILKIIITPSLTGLL